MKTFMRLFLCLILAAAFIFILFAGLAIADGPIIGEIRMYGGSTLPDGWLWCNGQPLERSGTYAPLYNVISTTYGIGDGSTTFNVPNFRSRFPLGRSLRCDPDWELCSMEIYTEPYPIGAIGGEISHTLTITETPAHKHPVKSAQLYFPASGFLAYQYWSPGGATYDTENTGGDAAHNTMPPYLAVNFIIAYTTTQITPTPTTTATATPTPTATSTPTATPTPGATPSAYTYTLSTGTVLYQPVSMNFGQIIVATIGVVLVSSNFLLFLFVKRRT